MGTPPDPPTQHRCTIHGTSIATDGSGNYWCIVCRAFDGPKIKLLFRGYEDMLRGIECDMFGPEEDRAGR